MSERGTSYTAEIETPSGLAFYAEIYVPPDAEYADQHELSEAAQMAASRMLASHLRGEEYRERARAEEEERARTCQVRYAEDGFVLACALAQHEDEGHRTSSGVEFRLPPPPF